MHPNGNHLNFCCAFEHMETAGLGSASIAQRLAGNRSATVPQEFVVMNLFIEPIRGYQEK